MKLRDEIARAKAKGYEVVVYCGGGWRPYTETECERCNFMDWEVVEHEFSYKSKKIALTIE